VTRPVHTSPASHEQVGVKWVVSGRSGHGGRGTKARKGLVTTTEILGDSSFLGHGREL
jgi:hypothetical protein